MRSDLDRILQARGLAGLVVLALDRYSPAFHYCTGQKIHHGLYLRAADGRAHLVHDPMERDQAALVPAETSSYAQHGFLQMVKNADSQARAFGDLIARLAPSLGLEGRVAFAGEAPLGFAYTMLSHLRAQLPGIEVDASQPDVIAQAAMTKGSDELERIRRCSNGAVTAMGRARAFLASLRPRGGAYVTDGGEPATLGHVRRLLHRTFAEFGLGEDGESIVAQGRDAGVPHNRGNDADAIRAGVPILIDIFPGEAGGGYHTDMTRTFCLGPAPPPLRTLYAQCREAFDAAMARVTPGEPCRGLQELVCDVFEKQGHTTVRQNQAVEEGYVHGLGHGVGLAVHEGPRLGGPPNNTAVLEPGHVVSVEPGLYYPSRGLGVRIEDLVAVGPDGRVENLTPAPYELEIEPA
ncbi:MAG TPA: Xaa-Pro peptidase family protein [Candidatus Eisenbacteria bacterium]|nr:Xaa-Pro peptidase family protein [Candidatus Eisenbacteria bacterium]